MIMKKNGWRKKIVFVVLFVLALLFFCFRAYFMPLDLIYCQGLVLHYFPYYFQETRLNRIEKDNLGGYGVEYRDIDVIRINFGMPHERYYDEVNKRIFDLWSETKEYLLKNESNKLNEKHIRLSITDHGQVTCLCNYDISDTRLLNKWIYCEGAFENWGEIRQFSDVYGVECYINDITDTQNLETDEWCNLAFLHIRTGSNPAIQEDIMDEITRKLPGVEITIEWPDNEEDRAK